MVWLVARSVDAAVRNMAELTGITAEEAIHMASLHPARLLGIDRHLGSLAVEKRADAIALNSGLHLQQIWIQGQALPLTFHFVQVTRSSIARPSFPFA